MSLKKKPLAPGLEIWRKVLVKCGVKTASGMILNLYFKIKAIIIAM
jgi:hypothetical protein